MHSYILFRIKKNCREMPLGGRLGVFAKRKSELDTHGAASNKRKDGG